MRSPVIAFSILAAAAVSPTLVSGAPTSPNPDTSVRNSPRQLPAPVSSFAGAVPVNGVIPANAVGGSPAGGVVSGLGIGGAPNNDKADRPSPQAHRAAEQQLHNPSSTSVDSYTSHRKRAMDMNTAGGNSYTGATGDTSGGSAVAISHGGLDGPDEDEEGDGLTNTGGATGGEAGDSYSGFSYGGDGDGKGAGGNAYSGSVGPSEGGDVINASDNGIDNGAANAGGVGGFSESGDSQGGDADGAVIDGVNTDAYNRRRKRGMDMGTAGGNAYTGASSNVDGGNVINHADNEGVVENDATNTGGDAGETYSGEANGGDGDGYGPGGNAYSGATGSAVGGSVVNAGGAVDNTEAVTGGAGGESESGDAQGGDA